MNTLFEKQIYIRLAEDGTGFLYTVKYGRLATDRGEIRLAEIAEARALPDVTNPCYVPLRARVAPTKAGER